ncbi:MAG TPA: hypothetical protein VHD85_21990 [Terracidiphilus sp.]|nr:hypothetical protein [Terracidiphilus sp.]
MKFDIHSQTESDEMALATTAAPLALPGELNQHGAALLMQMFRDPRVLEEEERKELVAQLRTAVELQPNVSEIRVLLGMALCVDLQAQEALEQLRESVRQAPDCFIARLKFGELLMRLRVCRQAAEETQKAAKLASNAAQADLARRQAAAIRTMLREGIERGGYGGLLSRAFSFARKTRQRQTAPVPVK